jgi:glutaredoxin-related protein|tara:strand:+ start:2415 stop:3017 length:603 start_codon:yes stop_codon:yes gene_type:complete
MNFDVPPTNSNSLTLEIPSDSSNSPHIAQAKEDLKSYLSEYSPAKWDFFGRCFGSANEKQLVGDYIIQFAEQVNTHDIVVFAKVGCGFCLRAKNALGERSEVDSFSMHVINVKGDRAVSGAESSAMQEALKKTINLYDLTFPQIVIKGRYVGGADTLLGLIDDNMFSSVLSEPRCRFEAGDKITWLRSLAEEVSGANNTT